jgi:hypothetical protein
MIAKGNTLVVDVRDAPELEKSGSGEAGKHADVALAAPGDSSKSGKDSPAGTVVGIRGCWWRRLNVRRSVSVCIFASENWRSEVKRGTPPCRLATPSTQSR